MEGVCAAGACPIDALRLDPHARGWLDKLCPKARTALVFLFPYYAGERSGNLSLYARGRDYHTVIRDALSPVAEDLRAWYPNNTFAVLADDSPLPEVRAAALAGLGMAGENGLLIHKDYGSYVFIGTIVTDRPCPVEPQEPRPCRKCGACRKACPSAALGEGGVDASRCLSALTQRNGALSPEEAEQLRRHPLIWGCDLCQHACPMNRDVMQTEILAFRDGLIDALTLDGLDGLTRRLFLERYPDRAFTWRGPAPLRRNLELKQGSRPGEPECENVPKRRPPL